MTPDFDVTIVGCGPVGATLAALLGQRGLHVVVLERETSIYHLPRAVVFDGEILRMYQALGFADGIAERSVPMHGFRMENEQGETLVDWEMPWDTRGDQGWGDSYMFHQPDVEALLRQSITRLPTVALRDGCEVEAVEQADDHVRISGRRVLEGDSWSVTAKYVVGCDGGGSTVRRTIGSRFQSLGPEQDWVVLDAVRLADLDLPDVMVAYCWPSRPHLFIPMGDRRLRWEFMVRADDDRASIGTPAGAAALIQRFCGPEDVQIERSVIYTFRSLLAERWQTGRVFLAGDAAHLQPPFRAQGLCSGIRDVVNLGWKLSAVLRGEAADRLLDTYEPERRAHASAWIAIATEMSNIVNTTDLQAAAGRDAHMLAHPAPYENVRPSLGPGGLGGQGSPLTGTLSLQVVRDDGTRLDDRVGWRFLVAITAQVETELSAEARELLHDNIRFCVLPAGSADAAALLELHGSPGAIIIRPDRYVLGTAVDAGELSELLTAVTAYAPRVAAA